MTSVAAGGSEGAGGRRERSGTRRAGHRTLIRRVGVHRCSVARIGDDRSASTARTAPETADILSKVVVAAHLVAALPVARTERNHTGGAVAVAHGSVMAHVLRRRQHLRGAVAIGVGHLARRTGTGRRERAAETGSSSLEVGKAARRARPIARARAILARWEGREDLCSSIEHPSGRRRDFDGLLVQGTAIHAQALRSLVEG